MSRDEVTDTDRIVESLDAIASRIEGLATAPNAILTSVLRLLERDSHHFSRRPCETCTAVSALANQPFGCVRRAEEKKNTP